MTDEQIKQMAERFLLWKLPADFHPDAGISFTPDYNVGTAYQGKHVPTGTNLFNYTQAEAMVRHMVSGVFSTEWCLNMAKQEGDSDIAAGALALAPYPLTETEKAKIDAAWEIHKAAKPTP